MNKRAHFKHGTVMLLDPGIRVTDRSGASDDVSYENLAALRYDPPGWLRRGRLSLDRRHGPGVSLPLVRRDRSVAEALMSLLQEANDPAEAAEAPATGGGHQPPAAPAAVTTTPVEHLPARRPRRDRAALLTYPTSTGAHRPERFAVVDVETSGLYAHRGARIVELSIVTTDLDGNVRDVFTTLIHPGRDKTTGPAHIHRITDSMVAQAPHFRDVAGEIQARLAGAALVAHNASFEEEHLAKAFSGIGRAVPALPALDTLSLARDADLPTANYRLATLADWAGIDHAAAHTAEGDARATAQLLPLLLRAARLQPRFDAPMWAPRQGVGTVAPVQRPQGGAALDEELARELAGYELAEGLRKGEQGWISNLLSRMPELPAEGYVETAQYIDVVTRALADGKIIGREAREMALLAGQLGLSAGQAHELHLDVLDGMAAVALEDGILTGTEFDLLTRAAEQMNAAGRFDHLAARVDTSIQGARATGQRRCGHCREVGHNRQTCPDLVSA